MILSILFELKELSLEEIHHLGQSMSIWGIHLSSHVVTLKYNLLYYYYLLELLEFQREFDHDILYPFRSAMKLLIFI